MRRTAETHVAGATTLPQRFFTSSVIFDEELERIFYSRYLCAGHASELAHDGDYVIRSVGTESVIILRDREHVMRAFHNVCRHRGTRLCEATSGTLATSIQCPYHAWTYSLDGQLIGAPHMKEVEGFDKRDYSLHIVALQTWEGLVFINLAEEPAPFTEEFAPLLGKFTHWNIPLLRGARRLEYDVRANWKLIFENYNECYHCPLVHPTLAKLTPYDKAENDLTDGPFLGGPMPLAKPDGSMTMSGNRCGVPLGDLSEEDRSRVWYYSIFPNLLLSIHPDYVMIQTLWPQATGRTLIRCDWLFHPDTIASGEGNVEDAIEFWDMTNKQDWHVCELAQQGIASRAYRPGPYSSKEGIPVAFDRYYLQALGRCNGSTVLTMKGANA